ncbi:MAG: DUF362 domain-containing protein [Bacteroidales bacterium]|nr:DUF362 domain-containing protein [Bacteroidales bacterium]
MKTKSISRRKLLKDATLASIAGTLYFNMPVNAFANTESPKSRVVLIRHKDIMDNAGKINQSIMQQMIDEAVVELTGLDLKDAWKSLVKPDDIVGIKSNVWKYIPTPSELEKAVKKRVLEAGVPEKNIGIRDRGLLNDEIFTNATALINMRPLRTHYWSGVGSLIKNYITFVEKPSEYHPDTCANLATLWKLPLAAGKTRLNVLVVLTPLFHGSGPHHYSKQFTWQYNGLLVGFDPVAVDSVGVKLLLNKRADYFGEERPLNPPAKHVFLADTRHHLGTADANKIELIKLGWEEGQLI